MSRSNSATSSPPNALSGKSRTWKRRMHRHGPSTATGGITMHTREPSGSRASTTGEAWSTRRPIGNKMRSIIRESSPCGNVPTCSTPPSRSIQISRPALIMISRTSGSANHRASDEVRHQSLLRDAAPRSTVLTVLTGLTVLTSGLSGTTFTATPGFLR